MINMEDIVISQPILSAVAAIDEYKGFWHGKGGIGYEIGNRLKEKALNESVAAITDKTERNNYHQLLEQIYNHYDQINFFESTVKKLHKLLLADSLVDEREKGEYKKRLNPVYSKTIDGRPIDIFFETASPFDTPQLMHKLFEWEHICTENRSYHPLIIIALFMVQFLIIHPFQDGNSRLARAIAMLMLLKSGYDYLQYTSLEIAIEDNKEEYYRCLRQTQNSLAEKHPAYGEWILFFLRTVQRLQKRLQDQDHAQSDDYSELPELSAQILRLSEQKERITLREATEKTQANINTVKKHLAALVNEGWLIRKGSARGTWYVRAK